MTQGLRERAAWVISGRLLGVAVVAVTMAASCSDSAPKATPPSSARAPAGAATTTTTTTTEPSKFASLYLQILGPADAATGKFFAAIATLPNTATGADAQKIATPAADAIDAADRQLLAAVWPGKVAADVRALVVADAQLVGDLRNLAPQPKVTSGAWKDKFEADVAQVTSRVNVVHADLQNPSK
jgi:hypothetical protein